MPTVPTPPSAVLVPPIPTLRERLATALREVVLLRRLIRTAESLHPPAQEAGPAGDTQGGRRD